jgi:pimeloyl-ACP methyl ester carboxylesterase
MPRRISPLQIEDQGAGAPLVLLHGMASDRHTWDAATPVLAQRHRVIRYDLRGFGQSPHPQQSYSHTDDLAQLLDECGVGACDLLSVSWGGSIALHFALEHPKRVHRLIVESPSMRGWDWSDAWRARAEAIDAAARNEGVAAARALWLRHPMFDTLRMHAEAFSAFAAGLEHYSGRHWLGDDPHAPLIRPDLERLHELEIPTLLITGQHDLEDIRLIAEAIAAIAPNVSRVDVPHAGHLVHLERPEAFLAAVTAFLR